jgi:hypothetical protein
MNAAIRGGVFFYFVASLQTATERCAGLHYHAPDAHGSARKSASP